MKKINKMEEVNFKFLISMGFVLTWFVVQTITYISIFFHINSLIGSFFITIFILTYIYFIFKKLDNFKEDIENFSKEFTIKLEKTEKEMEEKDKYIKELETKNSGIL